MTILVMIAALLVAASRRGGGDTGMPRSMTMDFEAYLKIKRIVAFP